MGRSATNRQRNVMELSGNFTSSGEWSPCRRQCCRSSTFTSSLMLIRLGMNDLRARGYSVTDRILNICIHCSVVRLIVIVMIIRGAQYTAELSCGLFCVHCVWPLPTVVSK